MNGRLQNMTVGDLIADVAPPPSAQKLALIKALTRSLPDTDRREVLAELALGPEITTGEFAQNWAATNHQPPATSHQVGPFDAPWWQTLRLPARRDTLRRILRGSNSIAAYLIAYSVAAVVVTGAGGAILTLIAAFGALIHHLVN